MGQQQTLARTYEQEDDTDTDPFLRIEMDNDTPIVGIELKPQVHMKMVFGCVFRWERLPTAEEIASTKVTVEDPKKPKLVSMCASYIPMPDDVGHKLRFSCILLTSTRGITKYHVTDMCIPLPQAPPDRNWIVVNTNTNNNTNSSLLSSMMNNLDKAFTMVTYNMMSLPADLSKQQYPHCPAYAHSMVYRRRIILRELQTYKADIMCLQQMDDLSQEYWITEMSKASYSAFTDLLDKKQQFYKCNLLYKRGKFGKDKDYVLRYREEFENFLASGDAFLKRIVPSNQQVIMGEQVAQIVLLEFKDLDATPDNPHSNKVLIVNTHVYKAPSNPMHHLIQTIQAYLLMKKLQSIHAVLNIAIGQVPLVIAGDLGFNSDSHLYAYLMKGTMAIDSKVLNMNITEACEMQQPYKLDSVYCNTYGNEPNIQLNDQNKTMQKVEDFIFFTPSNLTLRKTVELRKMAYPNADYVSDHIALGAQFELK